MRATRHLPGQRDHHVRLRQPNPRHNPRSTRMTEPEYVCLSCGYVWNSQSASDRCCDNDDLTGYSPSRNRLSFTPGYD